MGYSHPTPAKPVLPGKARIIQPALTYEINGAVGQICPNEGRNGFDNSAKFGLVLPKLLFGLLSILDVGEGPVPSDNFSTLVPKWDTTHQKPAIFPVSGATEPRLVFERLSGCNGDAPLLGMAHKIFGMDRTLPPCA